MTIQTFTAGQKLTALQMNTLQASDFNYTRNVRTESAYTFTLSDKGKLVESTFSGAATFTVPTNASEEFAIGDRIDVLLASDGSVTIAGAVGVTVYAESDLLTFSSKWTKVTLIKRATNSWVATGGGLAVQTVEIDNLAVTTAKLADDAVTGDKIADSSVSSAHIVDGTIVNADINASAAIALSKLATGTQGTVVIHNSSGVPTATALSGDITVTNAGVTAIGSSKVTSDMIVDGTIVNTDINASANIALSKIASGSAGQVVLANAIGVPTYTSISGDVQISSSGVATIQPNSVALGTDTTGNYVGDVVAGTGITVTHTPGEGSSPTIALAGLSFTTSSVAYTLQASDNNNLVEITASSAVDVTVPPSASVSWPNGAQITIFQRGAGKVRVLAGSGVTILSTPGVYLRGQYSGATLVRRDTNVWFLFGDLSST